MGIKRVPGCLFEVLLSVTMGKRLLYIMLPKQNSKELEVYSLRESHA